MTKVTVYKAIKVAFNLDFPSEAEVQKPRASQSHSNKHSPWGNTADKNSVEPEVQ